MTGRFRITLSICGIMALSAMICSVVGNAQGPAPPIHLKSFKFSPGIGQAPQIPPGLMIAGYAQNQRGYYLVQFKGSIEQSWKDELAALGAEILEYVPDFAFKVRMNPAQARRAGGLDSVVWVGIFQPAYKLSPNLVRNGTQIYVIRVERGANFGLTAAAVAATGAQILSRDSGIMIVAADTDQVNAIARVLDVAWMQNYKMWQKHNEYAGGVIVGANTANTLNYNGSSQTVAVADTGLGGGTKETAHADISPERISQIYNWPGFPSGCYSSISDDGAVDVDSGHGTHTTISAVGNSLTGYGKGVAPGANLVFQALENYVTMSWICSLFYGYPNGYYLTGIPSDLNQLYQQAHDAGARIHSNSWGAAVAGDYDVNSKNTDAFVWNHQDMVITFSAGNEGKDSNSDGLVDNDSIASPGTSKNVITVGASENARADYPCDASLTYTGCTGSNESIIVTYGTGFGFPANPLKDDRAEGNEDQMAAFSSRGPTDDGRIKPDVVAPGTYVLSGYSSLYQQQNGIANPQNGQFQYDGWAFPESPLHKYLGGTSMSSPLVAGSAAVVRDYYAKARSTGDPSAALVKATIINSAVDMLDENNDGVNDNDYPIPNSHEGWGRVNLAAATDGASEFVDNTTGISTNETAVYTAHSEGGIALKVTLVWSDYPSAESASVNLVNDLDLIVTSPGGVIYQGNVFSGGWSQTGGSPDRRNNVENAYIGAASAGDYTIQVTGYNTPYGPEPFALVVRGASLTDGSNPDLLDPEVSLEAPTEAAYLSTFTVTSWNESGSQPSYSSSGVCTNTGYAFTMNSGTGTCTATAIWPPKDNYKGATLSKSIIAKKIDPAVWIDAPDSQPNYSTFNLIGHTNSSSLPVYSSSGACTNNGSAYTMTSDSGICTATITWSADDNYNGATESKNIAAEPGTPPVLTVHVANLTMTSMSGGRFWVAGVSTMVHDGNEQPVRGAKVLAAWSGGYNKSKSCTTNSGGYCAITTGRISNTNSTVTFTVNNITLSGYTYDPESNYDMSGDSNGTTIVVPLP